MIVVCLPELFFTISDFLFENVYYLRTPSSWILLCDFLRTGGRQRAVETFADIGIDVRSPDPYERAASVFADYLDESPWA